MKDYYKILGASKNATQLEIKKAYRTKSKEVHPDVNQGEQYFEELFKEVQEAYEILGNEQKRRIYDSSISIRNNRLNSNGTRYNSTQPIIKKFKSNQTSFSNEEPIILHWKTQNADYIELRPFGQVPAFGEQSFLLNNFLNPFIIVELRATNTILNRTIVSKIQLENKSYSKKTKFLGTDSEYPAWFQKFRVVQIILTLIFLIAFVFNLVKSCQQNEEQERLNQTIEFKDY